MSMLQATQERKQVVRTDDMWQICYNTYLRRNKRLKTPDKTNLQNTYMWRYVSTLTKNVNEWGLDLDTATKLIEVAVDYQYKNKLSAKGLAILCQANLLKLCYSKLQSEIKSSNQTIESIQETQDYLNNYDFRKLTSRSHPDAYCELVKLYQNGAVSSLWLALSKTAGTILAKLNNADRSALPSDHALYLIRMDCASNKALKQQAQQVLGGDCKCL